MSSEPKTVSEVITQVEDRFLSVAPAHMKFDAEKGYAIQLMDNNSYLKQVAQGNPKSLLQAMANVAAIGLSLNPAEKLAYLITRTVKSGDKWESRVFLDVSYVGLIRLATDSGSIKWVQADMVYEQDTFTYNGAGEKPTHIYKAFSTERGAFVGVYCEAKTVDGDYLTTIMAADEVFSIRDRSEAYKAFIEKKKGNGGPWVSDFGEMAKKSVIRRAFKTWPRTDERRMARLAEAVEISNQNEGFTPILSSPNMGQYTADQKAYFDQLIEKSDSWGMFVFRQTLDEVSFTNLYHSFEKGAKGKYQRVVDELTRKGADTLTSMVLDIESATQSGDTGGVQEIIEGMPAAEVDIIRSRLSMDGARMLHEVIAIMNA